LNGIGLVKTIKAELPDTHVVVFTICKCEELIVAAMRAGASGYVVKADSGSDLLSTLQSLSAA
ncbi:MAG: response regulator transcription factor, partial [Alphaproteobacteria bacterium]